MALKALINSLRSDWWSALFLGVLVFIPLSLMAVVPLYIGPVLVVTLAPYLSARYAFRDLEGGRRLLGAFLGAIEATLLVAVVALAVTTILGSLLVSTLEGMIAVAMYALAIISGSLGGSSLDH